MTTRPVYTLDFRCVYVVSVALRLPAAYRAGNGSGKGWREECRFERLERAEDEGGKNCSSD